MKKIMITLGAVAMAACAQAAYANWDFSEAGDTTGLDYANEYAVYFFVDSATAGTAPTWAKSDAIAAIAEGKFSDTKALGGDNGIGQLVYSGAAYDTNVGDGLFAASSTVSAYLVLFDSDTAANATKFFVTDVTDITIEASGEGSVTFDVAGTNTPGNWQSIGGTSTPEPTSGLLLLLGVAGLALRRRRA